MPKHREERIAVVRPVYENTPLPDEVLAPALEWTPRYLAQLAKKYGWIKAPASLADLNRRARRQLERQLAALETDGTSGETLTAAAERARGDQLLKIHTALHAIARGAGNTSAVERVKSDAELTEVLRKIDERIVELAERYAGELVARDRAAEAGGPDAGKLDLSGTAEPA